jgi:hypothetical protein
MKISFAKYWWFIFLLWAVFAVVDSSIYNWVGVAVCFIAALCYTLPNLGLYSLKIAGVIIRALWHRRWREIGQILATWRIGTRCMYRKWQDARRHVQSCRLCRSERYVFLWFIHRRGCPNAHLLMSLARDDRRSLYDLGWADGLANRQLKSTDPSYRLGYDVGDEMSYHWEPAS